MTKKHTPTKKRTHTVRFERAENVTPSAFALKTHAELMDDARAREPEPAHLVAVDKKGNVVQEWHGDVNQAIEMRKLLTARGLHIRE